jgi:LysM repeat protein
VPRPRADELKRYAAPAAFLAAVTIAVLLIHSGLQGGGSATTAPSLATITATTTAAATTATTPTKTAGAQYYTVQSGDTLGAIASKYGTSVEQLQGLNPNLDPAALQPGQRIRVK